jgi:lipopolysaccharide biosynthesis glycosyltransferase
MDVVYAFDDRFSVLVGVSIESLLYNNVDVFDRIDLHLLLHEVSEENKAKVLGIIRRYDPNGETVKPHIYEDVDTTALEGLKTTRDWSIMTWARLLLPCFLPEDMDKVLYLDCDTVIDGSLKLLWDTDIDGYSVAGVLDCVAYAIAERERTLDLLSKPYINAGVLLVNLEKWRGNRLSEKTILYAQNHPDLTYVDQDAINELIGEKKILDIKYNNNGNRVMRYLRVSRKSRRYVYGQYEKKALLDDVRHTVIVHYSGSAYFNGLFDSFRAAFSVFKKYKRMGPYKDEPDYYRGGFMTRLNGWFATVSPVSVGNVYLTIKHRLKR